VQKAVAWGACLEPNTLTSDTAKSELIIVMRYLDGGFTPLPVVGTAGLEPDPGWCPPCGLRGVWTDEGW